VSSFDDVLSFLQRFASPVDTVDFTVMRGGESLTIAVTLGARPRN
jgi:S1-C subfamily serine protease